MNLQNAARINDSGFGDYDAVKIKIILNGIKSEKDHDEAELLLYNDYDSYTLRKVLESNLTDEELNELLSYIGLDKDSDLYTSWYYYQKSNIKSICSESSKDELCVKKEQKMKEMGIDINYSDCSKLAEIITDVYKDLYSKGYDMPKKSLLAI